MKGYRTSFTAGDGMLTVVVVDRESGGHVARFSWVPDETGGALGELAAALASMGQFQERRQQCQTMKTAGRRRPRQVAHEVSMLDGIDQAIELLELREGSAAR